MNARNEPTQRIIQESVPGRQITLAHVIANPQRDLYSRLGLDDSHSDALGILTITPYEGVIIAADLATKAGSVEIGFLDRFGGSLMLVGDVSGVESALGAVLGYFSATLGYECVPMTRT